MKKALFFFFIFSYLATGLRADSCDAEGKCERPNRSIDMSGHVFVVSEWLPKENCEEELWTQLKKIVASTKENESGCIRTHATRQVLHPGAPGKSKYKIVLLQEYVDVRAFDIHCNADYVIQGFKKFVENEETALVQDWCVRLFGEEE